MKSLITLIIFTISCATKITPFKIVDNVPLRLCSFPERVVPDQSIPFGFRRGIGLSVEYWEAVSDQRLFSFAEGYIPINSVVVQKVEDDGKLSSRDIIVSNARQCIVGARVYLRDKAFEDIDVLQTVMRKELGYVLGLDSSSDFTDLMYPNVDMTLQHPVDASEEQINAVNNIYSDGACY